jgi:deazaflavin-dependent oxidoreductase (nitroreductase family)
MARRTLAARFQFWVATSKLNQPYLMAAHAWLYRRTGGLIGSRMWGMPVLLLTTTGRRTGQPRITPLNYIHDDDGGFVVIASNSGRRAPPAWWLNLQAMPSATVRVGRAVKAVRAVMAAGAVRERLWARLLEQNPVYGDFQQIAGREMPLVILREELKA